MNLSIKSQKEIDMDFTRGYNGDTLKKEGF